MSTPTVAVVGAGASGTLATAHLARAAAASGRALQLVLVDPHRPARGLAYATRDPRHRLNVPAKGMSAWPDDPEHFLRWLHEHVDAGFTAGGFAPRMHYAAYLDDVLADARAASASVRVDTLATRVIDVRPHGRRIRLTFADGTNLPADAVVLAGGHDEPSLDWAPAVLRRSPRFVADAWRAIGEPELAPGDEVVLVGAGLTAIDMAMRWADDGIRVHVVSRHGMLPLAHATRPGPPAEAPTARPQTLAGARRMVFDAIRGTDGDWRRAIDGLRPITAELWQLLEPAERERFVRTASRRWDRVRHRIAPEVDGWLRDRVADGSLVQHAASVADATLAGDQLDVVLTDGTTIRAAAVVNCTGTTTPVTASTDPLVMNLLASGVAQPGPVELGFATDASGRLIGRTGPGSALWAIGPLRRGELWESTAIPEIRAQAAALASSVLAALPKPGLQRRPRDPYGLPLSASPAAADSYVEALGRVLRVQSGAEALIAQAVAADPGFALGHAALAVLGVEWGAAVDVEAELAAAHSAGARADERERRFIQVASARVRDPGPASALALLSYLQAYPEDALAVSLAVPTIAFGGATELPAEAWALVEGLRPVYHDDWWYLGLLAFTRQDQDRFDEAGELAARSLALQPGSGHAVHAKAHVHYETGDHAAGLAWLDRWIDGCGARASHRAHFSWHAALHELSTGDFDAVLARYAAQLAPPAVTGVRALVDSASLLWRTRLAGGGDIGEIAAVLRTVPQRLLVSPPTAFVALHSAVALAAARDSGRLLQLHRFAERQGPGVFADSVAPLVDALLDLVGGNPAAATAGLLELTGVERLGGSAAQREVVEDTLIYCAAASGDVELAAGLLDIRLARRDSARERAQRARLASAQPGLANPI